MSLADELHVTQLISFCEIPNRRIYRLITETAKRIPYEWMEKLLDKLHSVHLIGKDERGASLDITFAVMDLPKDFVDAVRNPVTKWVILLNEAELEELSDNAATFVIAHELAHVALKHKRGLVMQDRDLEREADDLAIAWGFEDEFRALRKK